MATPYSEIYNAALLNFRDLELLELPEDRAEEILYGYLKQSIAEFAPICKHNLKDRDEENKQFNETLTEEEVDILALGIVAKWLNQKVLFSDNLRDKLSTKDYTYHSRGNLLVPLKDLLTQFKKEFRNRMYLYSYDNGDLSSLHM